MLAANGFSFIKSTTDFSDKAKTVKIEDVENFNIRDHLLKLCDKGFVENLNGKSLNEAIVLIYKDIDLELTIEKVNEFINHHYNKIGMIERESLNFYNMGTKMALDSMARYLSEDSGIVFETDVSKPEPYLISSAILKNTVNYTTMPIVFAMIAKKFNIPVSLVNIEGHVFLRHESGLERFNVECSGPQSSGIGGTDEQYIVNYKAARVTVKNGVNMRSLNLAESIGMLFNNKMQYYYKKKLYREIDKLCAYALLFNDRDYFAIRTIMGNLRNSKKTQEKEYLYNSLVDHLNSMGGHFNKEQLTAAQIKQRRQIEIDKKADKIRSEQKRKGQSNDLVPKLPSVSAPNTLKK